MDFRNQIVGVIRFSYPATSGFAASRLGAGALEAMLYESARLERRFAMLEGITLPSLAAQTNGAFTCVILTGRSLPAAARDRLEALCARHPFLDLCVLKANDPLTSARRAFRKAVHADSTHVTGFRLDDDDAVAKDYVARVRARSDALLAGGFADGPIAHAFTRGLYWDLRAAERPFHAFREAYAPSAACAMITAASLRTCIYRYNHRRLGSFVPTFLEPGDAPMFVRTLHDTNDSGRTVPPHAEALETSRGLAVLTDRFGIDPETAAGLMAPAQ